MLVLAAALAGALVGWVVYTQVSGSKEDIDRFQGDWVVSTGGRGGSEGKPQAVAVRVEGDRWTYVAAGKTTAARIVLYTAASPKEIDLVWLEPDGKPKTVPSGQEGAGEEMKMRGVYTFEGDSIRLALAPNPEPRPKGFNPGEGSVMVLTRPKK